MSAKPPELKGFAQPTTDGRLFAPAAARNLAPISQELAQIVRSSGTALEIASGSGQHIIAHAAAHPDMTWHPSDIDVERRTSIDAYARAAKFTNLAPAIPLDATRPGWSSAQSHDLILLCNLLHLISATKARTLIEETAQALELNGLFFLYGPFMRDGDLISDGDREFHAALQAQDPAVGYKDDQTVFAWASNAGLKLIRKTEMPANNLAFTFQKA